MDYYRYSCPSSFLPVSISESNEASSPDTDAIDGEWVSSSTKFIDTLLTLNGTWTPHAVLTKSLQQTASHYLI